MIEMRLQTTISAQKWQWTTDAKGRVNSISELFTEATDIDPTAIIGKTFAEISIPVLDLTGESDKQLTRYLSRCKSKQGFRNIDLPIISPNNRVRIIRLTGRPEFGKRKKFLGYAGSGIDKTIEIEKNASIAAAYLPYAEMLDGLSNSFAIWDNNEHLLFCDDHFKSLFGNNAPNVRPGAMLKVLSRQLASSVLTIKPDAAPELLAADQRHGSNVTLERQVQFADGNWAAISARRIKNNITVTTITDITTIKIQEEEATRNALLNAQMATAIAAMDSGVIITNPNLPDNPIVFVNPSFISTKKNILGKPLETLFTSPSAKKSFTKLKRSMKRRETSSILMGFTDKSTSDRWFGLRLSPILNEFNQVSYFLGIQNDITAQKNNETELENRMRQQSAVADLGGKALAGMDLYELFDQALGDIADILDVRLLLIREHVIETDDLVIRTALGWRKNIVGTVNSETTPNPLIDRIFRSGITDSLVRTPAEMKRRGLVLGEKNIYSSIGVRIAGREHPFGLLSIHSKEARKFTPDEINFLETIAYVLGVAVEQNQAQEALKESEYRFELAVKGSNDGIWDSDLITNTLYCSSRLKAMLDLSEDLAEDTAEWWHDRTHTDDRELFRSSLIAHLKNETPYFTCEYRMLHNNGSYHWMLIRGLAIRDKNGRATRIAGSLSDISDAKRSEQQLLKDALHDSLTQLPNRALFTDRLVQSLTRSTRQPNHIFAVMFLDFDRFKLINDSLGHSFGDHILVEIGLRLKECTREVDTVARLGGDEFAILLDDLESEAAAEEIAVRINQSLGEAFVLSGREIVSNASIGIAFSSLGYSHPEEMIRDADIAMYQAKTEGRARHVIFEPGMHVRAVNQMEIETDLRRAIKRQEFTLAYQPVVDIKTEKLIGFEALIRWIHPENGFTPPGDFIPIAEETKLIIPIGRWVIAEACRQLVKWRKKFPHPDFTVSVNISPEQFKDNHLIDDIRNILNETGLDGKFLKVEITESAIMENPHEVTNRLKQLRDMNIQLHVDDFGTGYSSLSHLHRFPINALKIDRSFVISMADSQENMEIVRTIIALAHNLGLSTVAEGVESKADQSQLRKLNCDYAQGYYFSRPLSVEDAAKFIAKQAKPVKKKKKQKKK